MANPFYERYGQNNQNGSKGDLFSALAELKARVKDPNQAIQQMLASGQVTQAQYNAAVQKAQQLQEMLGRK